MSNLDREYLERRRRECLERAKASTDPSVASIHLRFATEYERKLAAAAPAPTNMSSAH